MGIARDEHSTEIDGHEVAVTGRTGPVHATWRLLVDGEEVDSARAAGDFALRTQLPEGAPVEAAIHQSLIGPTRVTFLRDGEEIHTSEGFVA